MNRVALQRAYVLHRRQYRETSLLLDVLTVDYGRVGVIAKGVKRPKSGLQGLLQPFVPLVISWVGRGELMTLTHAESVGELKPLIGECLFSGFYLNELLVALLQKWDPHTRLFQAYEQTIMWLKANKLKESVLRSFEKCLLQELGYGLFENEDFNEQLFYRFIQDHGFVESAAGVSSDGVNIFSGRNLQAIADENWFDQSVLLDAKRLTRLLLAPLLGQKQVYSRQLFVKPEEGIENE